MRRADAVRRRSTAVRTAEGGDTGAGAFAAGAARATRRSLPRRVRRRRHRLSTARGAAGGLAGGLLAVGARLLPGFELVAEHVGLDERLAAADVVVTGEGYLDAQSLDGKVVGGVCDLAAAAGVPVIVIVGDADPEVGEAQGGRNVEVVSLVERFGERRAFAEPRWCIEQATRQALESSRS